MAAILIKNCPPELHRQLKARAKRNRRSMNQEALTVLRAGMGGPPRLKWPEPVKCAIPITTDFIQRAIREGQK